MRSGVLLCQVHQTGSLYYFFIQDGRHALFLADCEQAGEEGVCCGDRAEAKSKGAVHSQLQEVGACCC
jgi:hypothetical protein